MGESGNDFLDHKQRTVETHMLCCINSGLVRRVVEQTGTSHNGVNYVFAVRKRSAQAFLAAVKMRTDYPDKVALLRDPEFRAYLNQAKKEWHKVSNLSDLHLFYQHYPRF